jgi:2,5-furandicarboxylate decarboxylase 1
VTRDRNPHSLREVIHSLGARCLRVGRAIDRSWEASAILDRLERSGRFQPVLFENIKGFAGWSILGNLFADRRAIADALGIELADMNAEITTRLEHPIEPVMVTDAPVHQYVADRPSLDNLPVPTLHERDAGPYLSMGVAICRDPDSGVRNVGVYRFMQRAPGELVPSLTSLSNAADIFAKYEARGEPMDLAIVPGVSPALALAASYKAAVGVDECALAGGLAGEPLRMSRARSLDLEVPADAEIVIETQVMPGERYPEAPFADMSRAYSRQKLGPLVRVKTITHRDDPILQLAFSGHAETSNMAAICHEVAIWRAVRQATGCVRAVHVPASGYAFHCYLSVTKRPTIEGRERGEHSSAMLAALAAVPQIKLVAAFDDDVDIFDDHAVLGAIARRFQAVDPLSGQPRLHVLPNMRGATYDPSSFHREYPNAKVMLDATIATEITAEQRESFNEAVCVGSADIRLGDYFPEIEDEP